MSTHINFLLKVKDATLSDIKRALAEARIDVRSIVKLHEEKNPREDTPSSNPALDNPSPSE